MGAELRFGPLSRSLKLAGSAASSLTARDGKGGQTREVERVLPAFQSKFFADQRDISPTQGFLFLQVAQLTDCEGVHTCEAHVWRTMRKTRRGFLTAGRLLVDKENLKLQGMRRFSCKC